MPAPRSSSFRSRTGSTSWHSEPPFPARDEIRTVERVRGMRGVWQLTGGSARGSALLLGLYMLMVLSLLGVGFLEMTRIEASLVTKDQLELQAFYCADAQAARIYNLYELNRANNQTGDPNGTLGPQTFGPTILPLASGKFRFRGSATVASGSQVVTITATCTLVDSTTLADTGTTRTVQRGGSRAFLNPGYQYTLAAGGFNTATGHQDFLGDLILGGNGGPVKSSGNNYSLGKDTITGRVYVAGNVYLGGESAVNPYGPGDPGPRITVYPGRSVVDKSSGFDDTAAGAVAYSSLNPMPVLSNAQGTGLIDQIRAAVTPAGVAAMKGTYNGTTVYNLTEIFNQLGQTNEGNNERNLARPSGCTFGVASGDPKCQVWQDLVIVGPKQLCAPSCGGVMGPTDKPSY